MLDDFERYKKLKNGLAETKEKVASLGSQKARKAHLTQMREQKQKELSEEANVFHKNKGYLTSLQESLR